MRIFKSCVLLLILSGMLLILWACGRTDVPVDRPGMEYMPQWKAFTLEKHGRQAFSFTVSDDKDEVGLTGWCIDTEGKRFEKNAEIVLSPETGWQLRRLDLERLEENSEDVSDGAVLCLTLPDGTFTEKKISGELAGEIYQLLFPYVVKK